ncbi:MAG: hypothetical protein J6B75_02485 [Ruminococcus sp.]|nr:hypothetical protein [Ruminococcus sp.]
MKQNIIFTVLTAIILALGFYAMDIAELFGFGKDEEKLIAVEKAVSKQVYLSNTNTQIAPMELIRGSVSDADETSAAAASAIVRAMAKNSDLSAISWGTHTDLLSSWKISENGWIFINGWEYVSKRKNTRLLDCIIDAESLTVVYIRFYDSISEQPSSADVNQGLKQLAEDSEFFYTSLDSIALELQEEILGEASPEKYTNRTLNITGLKEQQDVSIYDTYTLNYQCFDKYTTMKNLVEELYNSELASFMIAPASLSNISILDGDTETEIGGVMPILEKIKERPEHEPPEYTAFGSCIYQTVALGDERFTVIYNVLSNNIEGYFYDGNFSSNDTSDMEIIN